MSTHVGELQRIIKRLTIDPVRDEFMGKDPSKIKHCPECRRLVDAAAMRPISRTHQGSGLRRVCVDCFEKITKLRKSGQRK